MLSVPLQAQTAAEEKPAPPLHGKLVPPAVLPMPFSTDARDRQPDLSIEFRSASQMTEKDRNLADDAEASIAEHAGFSGFELEQGKWSYQQILCPALPNHLFLQYRRNNGTGDVSVFSASIPRGTDGRVRIIPILRRGYSLFSPAPINALTISAFNHIRAEEPSERSSDWLGTGLCYAALAGARPRIDLPDREPGNGKLISAMTAILEVPTHSGEIIRFVDAAATPQPMEWSMTFTAKGKLIKATHMRAPVITTRPVPQNSAGLKTRPVPQVAQD